MQMNTTPIILFRRLWRSDLTAFREHLLRLDPRSRHDRFAMGVGKDFLDHYAQDCFAGDNIIYGCFVDGVLRGAGELHRIQEAAGEAEAAFSVEDEWRHNEIGTKLFSHVIRAARNRRIQKIRFSCLAHNMAMRKLAHKFSAEIEFGAGDCVGQLVPRPATALSLCKEAMIDTVSLGVAMLDTHPQALETSDATN
ncbi:GNAT family N-acetyltransferase [Methylovirgula sp. 4M-Z18]|uniref:GNAT family N-acetyltransferase n=1 Tax=Methylovirgula sp. 4M-Z18 TaxID=2293567 RepID=UPI000E2EF3FC|nr:GNAT family N-acetyltransferase [Methylovirgula sp. 4M-Z18]RFB79313.1 GNAT family N-acetyltransferase [Methylovirgula sp. 4M-Z18]